MFRSLRFRLPALFLLGIVVSGLIAAVIALRLFQDHVLDRSKAELRREAIGLTEVFARQAIRANTTGEILRIAGQLERATGDRLFYIGLDPFPGQQSRLTQLPVTAVLEEALFAKGPYTFEFEPPGQQRSFSSAANRRVSAAVRGRIDRSGTLDGYPRRGP